MTGDKERDPDDAARMPNRSARELHDLARDPDRQNRVTGGVDRDPEYSARVPNDAAAMKLAPEIHSLPLRYAI